MSVVVPHDQLDPRTLDSLIEEFVTRDGAVYGQADTPLGQRMGVVREQLQSGQALIVFDEEEETCTILTKEQWRKSGGAGV